MNVKTRKHLNIQIGITLIIINQIIGHFLPPMGIMLTPILLPIISLLIILEKNISVWKITFASSFLFMLNDLGLKSFAGGTHDLEGLGVIIFTFMIVKIE